MILGAIATLGRDFIDYRYLSRRLVSLTAPGVIAVAFGTTFGVWTCISTTPPRPSSTRPRSPSPAAHETCREPLRRDHRSRNLRKAGPGFGRKKFSVRPAAKAPDAASRPNAQFGELVPFPPADISSAPADRTRHASNTLLGELVPVPPQRPREFATAVEEPAPLARPDRSASKPAGAAGAHRRRRPQFPAKVAELRPSLRFGGPRSRHPERPSA